MSTTAPHRFLVRLRNLRKSRRLSQAAAAKRVELHTQTVYRWERGLFVPDEVTLNRYLSALEVTDDDQRELTFRLRREFLFSRAAA